MMLCQKVTAAARLCLVARMKGIKQCLVLKWVYRWSCPCFGLHFWRVKQGTFNNTTIIVIVACCCVVMWETPSVFHISTRFSFLLLFSFYSIASDVNNGYGGGATKAFFFLVFFQCFFSGTVVE